MEVPGTLLGRSPPYCDSMAPAGLILWLCCHKDGRRGKRAWSPYNQSSSFSQVGTLAPSQVPEPGPMACMTAKGLGSYLPWAWKVRIMSRWALLIFAMGSFKVRQIMGIAFTFDGWTVSFTGDISQRLGHKAPWNLFGLYQKRQLCVIKYS